MVQRAVNRRLSIAVIAALSLCLASCGPSADQTYIEISADGVAYHLPWAKLVLLPLPNGETFVSLGQDATRVNIVTAVPNVGMQWRMSLDAPADLPGQSIDLADPGYDGLATFSFTEDFAVVSLEPAPRIRIVFDQLLEGVILGRFEAEGFVPVGAEVSVPVPVRIEGRFRARLDAG